MLYFCKELIKVEADTKGENAAESFVLWLWHPNLYFVAFKT